MTLDARTRGVIEQVLLRRPLGAHRRPAAEHNAMQNRRLDDARCLDAAVWSCV